MISKGTEMKNGFFLSSMMGITDGKFCAERSVGCNMVQLGAYLAEPTAGPVEKAHQTSSFLPADWDECVPFLAKECTVAKLFKNLASPRLDWAIKAAECFHLAGGNQVELNVHGGYQRYLDQGKLRAMVLPENQAELVTWIKAFRDLQIPLIVKFNGQFNRPHLVDVLQRIKEYDLYGIHINIRDDLPKRPDISFTRQVRNMHKGLLLVSGHVRSASDAALLFNVGADLVGFAEPTISDARYIQNIAAEFIHHTFINSGH